MTILNLHAEATANSATFRATALQFLAAACSMAARAARVFRLSRPDPEEVLRVENHREAMRARADRLMVMGR